MSKRIYVQAMRRTFGWLTILFMWLSLMLTVMGVKDLALGTLFAAVIVEGIRFTLPTA